MTPSPNSSQPNSSRRIEDPVFGQAAQVKHGHGGRVEEIQREIAVAGNVHAVARDGVETQIARHGLAVERETAAGQRAGAERQHVGAPPGFAEAFEIAREHFEIRQQIVRPQHRLRAPHVRIARNHGVGIAAGQLEQRPHQAGEQAARAVAFVAQPQPRVERDLLVAAAAGVDLVRDSAGLLLQLADHQRVDVFIAGALVKRRLRRLRADLIERGDDPRAFLRGEDADPLERPREGLRAANIGIDQPPVEIERAGKALEDFRRPGLEPPAPELHALTSPSWPAPAL